MKMMKITITVLIAGLLGIAKVKAAEHTGRH